MNNLIKINNINVNYIKKGDGTPVIFLHGWGQSLNSFTPMIEELSKVHGVGEGKARKFGKEFIDLISKYVEDNDVVRPDDLIVKSTGVNSGLKLYIIQNTDRKLPLIDIAKSKGLDMEKLIKEMEVIIFSGTKLNIDYYIHRIMDDEREDILLDYFMNAETDHIKAALDELEGEDFTEEELRVYRIKFISEHAN